MATNMFFLLNVSLVFGADKYNWPPIDGGPIVTLLGPIYETGSETKALPFKALEKAMTSLVERQPLFLPELYQTLISGLEHQLFRPGYSNDEEWGSIKNLGSQAKNYDPERIAGILATSEYRKPGLEMAIRMQPVSEKNPDTVTLEGYRFVFNPDGKGQAEWYTQEVKLRNRNTEDAFRKAINWLLVKPFSLVQKSLALENQQILIWSDNVTAGTLLFADKKFNADAEPVRKYTLDICIQTGICQPIKMEGNDYAIVSNIENAQTICQMFGREVIDENTLLRLALNDEGLESLGLDSIDVWHSGDEAGHFEEEYNHWYFVPAKSGVVWCQIPKNEKSPIFTEHQPNYLLEKNVLSLAVYQNQKSGGYLRFGESMVVERLEQGLERFNVNKFWVVENPFATDIEEKKTIDIRDYPISNSSVYVERNTMDIVFKCRPEVDCDSFEKSVPVYRIGYRKGRVFGHSYGGGFIKNNIDYDQYNEDAQYGTVSVFSNLYFDYSFEQPLRILPGFRWSFMARLDMTGYSQTVHDTPTYDDSETKKEKTTTILQLVAGAKLSYFLGVAELYIGSMANSGGSGNYSNSSTSNDSETSETTYYTVYYEKVRIKSGVVPLLGIAFTW